MEPAHALAELAQRGWVLLPGLFDEATCDELRAAAVSVWEACGRPPLQAAHDLRIGDGVGVDPVGLVITEFLGRRPEFGQLLLRPELLRIFEAALGGDPRLESVCAVLSDESRPFFFWHNHVGGIDGEWYRRHGDYVAPERIERLVCSIFFSPLDREHGTMLIKPRRLGDPNRPPDRLFEGELDGCVEITCPAGSAVVFDQSTLHAVRPMQRPGQRGFMGSMLVRSDLPPTRNVDPGIVAAASRVPALQRFVASNQ